MHADFFHSTCIRSLNDGIARLFENSLADVGELRVVGYDQNLALRAHTIFHRCPLAGMRDFSSTQVASNCTASATNNFLG